jgi:hypothetical protein
MTAQEVELVFHRPETVSQTAEDAFLVDYDILQLADGQGPPPSLPKNCKSSEQPWTRPTQGMLFE